MREYVLADKPTIDLTARFLERMVKEDPFTKRLFTRLFIILLGQQYMIDDTRGLVVWAIRNWLNTDEQGRAQLAWLLTNQVLNDKKFILPGLYKLLDDYLEDDKENLEGLLAE